jgi:hypothetical protein
LPEPVRITKKDVLMKQNSRRWFWTGIVLISLGLLSGLYFGFQVYLTRVEEIFISLGVTDTQIKSFQKFDCPRILNPGETGVVTVVLPYPSLYNSIRVRGTRLDVKPVPPVSRDSLEVKWEITARGGGNGVFVVEAPSELDRSLPESSLYWGSMYHQACSMLVSVLGLPARLYVLLDLVLAAAGVGAVIRWVRGLQKNH